MGLLSKEHTAHRGRFRNSLERGKGEERGNRGERERWMGEMGEGGRKGEGRMKEGSGEGRQGRERMGRGAGGWEEARGERGEERPRAPTARVGTSVTVTTRNMYKKETVAYGE